MAHYESERSFKENYIYHQTDTNLRFPMHLHRSFEFVTVTSGSIELIIEQNKFILNKGDCVIIMPNEAHQYTTPLNSNTYLCVFSTDFVCDFANATKDLYAINPIFHIDNIEQTIENLKKPHNIYHLKSNLYRILSIFYENSEFRKSIKQYNDLTHKILAYIEEHLRDNLTLNEIAKEIGYTYNYISTIFNKLFGADFPQILNECRINEACYLLQNPDIKIAKISSLCGYNSLRSFNRNFLEIKKMTPTEYKQENNL